MDNANKQGDEERREKNAVNTVPQNKPDLKSGAPGKKKAFSMKVP